MSDYDTRQPPDIQIERAHVERNPAYDGFDVHLRVMKTRDKVDMMLPLENPAIRTYEHGDQTDPRPAFRLDVASAQAMLDGLWSAGLRPTSGDKAADQTTVIHELRDRVEDLKEHIEDLRHVAQIVRPKDQPFTSNGDMMMLPDAHAGARF